MAGTITVNRVPKLSPLPPSGIPTETTTPEWAWSELLALDLKTDSPSRIPFPKPPGATEKPLKITLPSHWDRRSGAPFIFDIDWDVRIHGGDKQSTQVWRYQLYFDESDLLDDDRAVCRVTTSRVEVLDYCTMASGFSYFSPTAARSPRVPCNPQEIPARYFLTDRKPRTQPHAPMTQSSNRFVEGGALLAQYTLPPQMENEESIYDEGQRQVMVTTILARPSNATPVPVYCTFSGRAVYSTYANSGLQIDGFGLDNLVNVTVYDFLN